MSENLTKFVHSIKVPRIYKSAAKIVKIAIENGGSIKHLLYSTVKANLKGCYALVTKTVQNNGTLEDLLSKTKILEENPQLDVFLAKTLVTELIFGKGSLQGESKPVQTILRYADALFKEFEAYSSNSTNNVKSDKLKPRYVRVNTLKATCDEVIKELRYEGWQIVSFTGSYPEFIERIKNLQEDEFIKDMNIKDLLIFPPRTEFFRHYLYQDATLILQDKASCLPPLVLQVESTSNVLDMCAAPGMKTTMMSALMRNKGKIHAMEQSERRHSDLEKIVKLAGCENVETHLMDSLKIPNDDTPWANEVDLILLDPTCSCSGMTEEARHFAKPKDDEKVRKLAGYQKNLLLHALTMFPSARKVVYSTCSTLCEENEEVVAFALRKVSHTWTVAEASPNWPSRGSSQYEFGTKCLTAKPEEDQTTGFFVALFEKNDQAPGTKKIKKRKKEVTAIDENEKTEISNKKKKTDDTITIKAEPEFDELSVNIKSEPSELYVKIENLEQEGGQQHKSARSKKKKSKYSTEPEQPFIDSESGPNTREKKHKKKRKESSEVDIDLKTEPIDNKMYNESYLNQVLGSEEKIEKLEHDALIKKSKKKRKETCDEEGKQSSAQMDMERSPQKKMKKKKKGIE